MRDDLRTFILTSIPSVPYAEALLLMRRNPATSWDAQRLARLLYVSDVQALDLLRRLFEAGFVTISEDGNQYAYGPATPELAAKLDAFAETYQNNLMVVTELIHSPFEHRSRQLADAFRRKKD